LNVERRHATNIRVLVEKATFSKLYLPVRVILYEPHCCSVQTLSHMKSTYRLNTGYPNTPTNTHVDFPLHSTLDRIAGHVRTFYLSVIQGFSRQVATEVEKKTHTTCGKGAALATTHKRIIHETKILWIHRLEGRTRYRLAFHRREVRLLFCTVYSPPRFIKDWHERRMHASPPRPVVQTSTVFVDAGSCPVGPPQKGVEW
jgi:hypothetical protein